MHVALGRYLAGFAAGFVRYRIRTVAHGRPAPAARYRFAVRNGGFPMEYSGDIFRNNYVFTVIPGYDHFWCNWWPDNFFSPPLIPTTARSVMTGADSLFCLIMDCVGAEFVTWFVCLWLCGTIRKGNHLKIWAISFSSWCKIWIVSGSLTWANNADLKTLHRTVCDMRVHGIQRTCYSGNTLHRAVSLSLKGGTAKTPFRMTYFGRDGTAHYSKWPTE